MTQTTYSEGKMGERYPLSQVKITIIWTHFPELKSERGILISKTKDTKRTK